jgi:hypothetical protein
MGFLPHDPDWFAWIRVVGVHVHYPVVSSVYLSGISHFHMMCAWHDYQCRLIAASLIFCFEAPESGSINWLKRLKSQPAGVVFGLRLLAYPLYISGCQPLEVGVPVSLRVNPSYWIYLRLVPDL